MPTPPIDMIIAGAAKAGTNSLLRYLGQHPDVCAQREPELGFFVLDRQHAAGYLSAHERYFGHCDGSTALLAKNAGLMYSRTALKRLADHNAGAHVVIILRDPIDRAYSHFWFARQLGHEPLGSFEAAIAAEPQRMRDDPERWGRCAYIGRSDYVAALGDVGALFPQERTVIATTDMLETQPQRLCRQLFRHLGVDDTFSVDVSARHNSAAGVRWPALARAMRPQTSLARTVRAGLPRRARPVLYRALRAVNRRRITIAPLDDEVRQRITDRFPSIAAATRLVDDIRRTADAGP